MLTFGISCSCFSGHATASSFPFGDVLVMSNVVGGETVWQKNQFLLPDNIERNLKQSISIK